MDTCHRNETAKLGDIMKILRKTLIASIIFSSAPAFAAGHYVTGVEGIQAASAPPPGFYYLAYLVNYQISGISKAPGDNTGSVSALVNRLVWISPHKLLGADYGMEMVAPIQATSLTFDGLGVNSTSRGLGDIYIEPLILAWHGQRYDFTVAVGQWLSNGKYSSTNPSSIGLGYKSTMLTVGGTYYIDAKKLWSVSILSRFEKNGSQTQTGITPGDGLSLEYGVGRKIGDTTQLGLVGYYQAQTTTSTGPNASPLNPKKSAIGIEFDKALPTQGMALKFAAYHEYSATDGATKGNLFRMTLVKAF